jgi:hypothetical protein
MTLAESVQAVVAANQQKEGIRTSCPTPAEVVKGTRFLSGAAGTARALARVAERIRSSMLPMAILFSLFAVFKTPAEECDCTIVPYVPPSCFTTCVVRLMSRAKPADIARVFGINENTAAKLQRTCGTNVAEYTACLRAEIGADKAKEFWGRARSVKPDKLKALHQSLDFNAHTIKPHTTTPLDGGKNGNDSMVRPNNDSPLR